MEVTRTTLPPLKTRISWENHKTLTVRMTRNPVPREEREKMSLTQELLKTVIKVEMELLIRLMPLCLQYQDRTINSRAIAMVMKSSKTISVEMKIKSRKIDML